MHATHFPMGFDGHTATILHSFVSEPLAAYASVFEDEGYENLSMLKELEDQR